MNRDEFINFCKEFDLLADSCCYYIRLTNGIVVFWGEEAAEPFGYGCFQSNTGPLQLGKLPVFTPKIKVDYLADESVHEPKQEDYAVFTVQNYEYEENKSNGTSDGALYSCDVTLHSTLETALDEYDTNSRWNGYRSFLAKIVTSGTSRDNNK